MSRFAETALLFAVLLAGCSQNRPIDAKELKSDATELISISAEGELFADFVSDGHASEAYTKGHRVYLREQLKDLRRELDKKNAHAPLQSALRTLQDLAQQLNQILNTLPANSHDHRWPALAHDFDRISRAARDLRRTL